MKFIQKIKEFLSLKEEMNERFQDVNVHINHLSDDMKNGLADLKSSVIDIQYEIHSLQRHLANLEVKDNFERILSKIEKFADKKDQKNIKEQVDRLESCLKSASSYVIKVNDQYFTIQSTLSKVNRIEEELEKLTKLGSKKTAKKVKDE